MDNWISRYYNNYILSIFKPQYFKIKQQIAYIFKTQIYFKNSDRDVMKRV